MSLPFRWPLDKLFNAFGIEPGRNSHNVGSQREVTRFFPFCVNSPLPQLGQEFFSSLCTIALDVCLADSAIRVRVTSSHRNLPVSARQCCGRAILRRESCSVPCFESIQPREQRKHMRGFHRSRRSGSKMVQNTENALFVEKLDEFQSVTTQLLDFAVLAFIDSKDANVTCDAVLGKHCSYFASDNNVVQVSQLKHSIDRVVVCDGDKIHATLFRGSVNILGCVVGFVEDF